MDRVTASPPVSPRVVERIFTNQNEKLTAATLLRHASLASYVCCLRTFHLSPPSATFYHRMLGEIQRPLKQFISPKPIPNLERRRLLRIRAVNRVLFN